MKKRILAAVLGLLLVCGASIQVKAEDPVAQRRQITSLLRSSGYALEAKVTGKNELMGVQSTWNEFYKGKIGDGGVSFHCFDSPEKVQKAYEAYQNALPMMLLIGPLFFYRTEHLLILYPSGRDSDSVRERNCKILESYTLSLYENGFRD